MPFVPLGSRKRLELVLDDDKVTHQPHLKSNSLRARQDYHATNTPFADLLARSPLQAQTNANRSYKFAKHPVTMGGYFGPPTPFQDSHTTWRPPSAERNGPAQHRASAQAPTGACWDRAHGMRRIRSSPTIQSGGVAALEMSQMSHPMTAELKRWNALSKALGPVESPSSPSGECGRRSQEVPKDGLQGEGLINFPKYMLWNDCQMKQQDKQRYVQEKQAERQALAAQKAAIDYAAHVQSSDLELGAASRVAPAHLDPQISQYDPILMAPAGSKMPTGRCCRTSNPYRLG